MGRAATVLAVLVMAVGVGVAVVWRYPATVFIANGGVVPDAVLSRSQRCKLFRWIAGRPKTVFLDSSCWEPAPFSRIARPGDVVVSSMMKSGTTWTRQIVDLLRHQTDTAPESSSTEAAWFPPNLKDSVPFPDFVHYPDETLSDRIRHYEGIWARAPDHVKRGIATHATPPLLPLRDDLRYVVVARAPVEVFASVLPYLHTMSDQALDLWGRCDHVPPSTFADFKQAWLHHGMADHIVHNHLLSWWPHRNRRNVLLVHYADLKRDIGGTVNKIASFLGIKLTDEQHAEVLRKSSFQWMKAHSENMTGSATWIPPFVRSGALPAGFQFLDHNRFFRSGKTGAAASDIDDESIAQYSAMLDERLADPELLQWALHGEDSDSQTVTLS